MNTANLQNINPIQLLETLQDQLKDIKSQLLTQETTQNQELLPISEATLQEKKEYFTNHFSATLDHKIHYLCLTTGSDYDSVTTELKNYFEATAVNGSYQSLEGLLENQYVGNTKFLIRSINKISSETQLPPNEIINTLLENKMKNLAVSNLSAKQQGLIARIERFFVHRQSQDTPPDRLYQDFAKLLKEHPEFTKTISSADFASGIVPICKQIGLDSTKIIDKFQREKQERLQPKPLTDHPISFQKIASELKEEKMKGTKYGILFHHFAGKVNQHGSELLTLSDSEKQTGLDLISASTGLDRKRLEKIYSDIFNRFLIKTQTAEKINQKLTTSNQKETIMSSQTVTKDVANHPVSAYMNDRFKDFQQSLYNRMKNTTTKTITSDDFKNVNINLNPREQRDAYVLIETLKAFEKFEKDGELIQPELRNTLAEMEATEDKIEKRMGTLGSINISENTELKYNVVAQVMYEDGLKLPIAQFEDKLGTAIWIADRYGLQLDKVNQIMDRAMTERNIPEVIEMATQVNKAEDLEVARLADHWKNNPER